MEYFQKHSNTYKWNQFNIYLIICIRIKYLIKIVYIYI